GRRFRTRHRRPPAPDGGSHRRAADGIRLAPHGPRLGLHAGACAGGSLRADDPGQPAWHRERAGAAHGDDQRLGPKHGLQGREGDPRLGARDQSADQRHDHHAADPGTERGAPPRADQGRCQLCGACPRGSPQPAARRHGPDQEGEERRVVRGRREVLGVGGRGPHQALHQDRRSNPRGQAGRDHAGL
ncbi:MAG: Ribosome recycling factor, partial [uncultured Rubellimicrobium sp.]